MKQFRDFSLGTKFSIITAIALILMFAIVTTSIFYYQKAQLITENDERFFSQLSDLVSIIDVQRKAQEEKVTQALILEEKLIQEHGQIIETDSLLNFIYTDPKTDQKQTTQVKAWKLGSHILQGDTLIADEALRLTGCIFSIDQLSPVGYVTVTASKVPMLNNVRFTGSITNQKELVDAINSNTPYLGTTIGTISKKIITLAHKNLTTDKGSKVVLYAYSFLQDEEGIKKSILGKVYLESGYAYLMSSKGIILFHPKAPMIGMDLSKVKINKGIDGYKELMAHKEGFNKLYYFDQNGVAKYQYYTYYAPFDIFINIVLPEKELLDNKLIPLRNFLLIGSILAVIICNAVINIFLNKYSTRPIRKISANLSQLAQGKSVSIEKYKQEDEYGQIFDTMNQLIERINNASYFAKEVGKGNLNVPFLALNKEDELGNALIEMRDDIREANELEQKRKWANEGLAKFNEIIRKNANQAQELTFQVLAELVRYIDANQGAIFLIEEDDKKEPCLELTASYAYNRRKYSQQRIYMGDGLVGQVWQEGEMLYLTKIPPHYVRIGSGLGDALPTCLFVVPMKFNEEIQGIIEIASFKKMEDHEKEFVLKIMESLAAAVSVAKFNENTKKLLKESQYMMENLRSQEEEMRQNYEELQATQEEMFRREQEARVEKEELMIRIEELQSTK
jgi:putative methionine-R-sulfoxide reductase with GAF domain